jgi:hypothetical protein
MRKPRKITVVTIGKPPMAGMEYFAQVLINMQIRESAEKAASDAVQQPKLDNRNRG